MSRLLRIPDAAAELAIGRSQLYELIASGEIRAVKIGTRGVRVPATELDRFVLDRLGIGPKVRKAAGNAA